MTDGIEISEWRQRYDAAMREADETWRDVTAALGALEVEACVIQTGGMCLAIYVPCGRDGAHMLITDIEGTLPWDRSELGGWAVGWYPDDEAAEAVGWGDTEDTSVDAAVQTALAVLAQVQGR